MQTFAGTFSRRYPGRWVPVNWAYSDAVNICQRADEEHRCNIIFETLTDNRLVGSCATIPVWYDRAAVAQQFGVLPEHTRLLGQLEPSLEGPLRDGDIFHHNAALPPDLAHRAFLSCLAVLAWALLHASPGRILLGICLFSQPVTAAPDLVEPVNKAHWLWTPFSGRIGPGVAAANDLVAQLLTVEPWWEQGCTAVRPRPCGAEAHWVPRSPSPLFAVVLVVGAPAPAPLLLPCQMTKALLYRVVGRYFDALDDILGCIPQLAAHAPSTVRMCLRDGDVLHVRASQWRPTLHPITPPTFEDHRTVQSQGTWSHPLIFQADCWILLWRPHTSGPLAVYAEGQQRWDPVSSTLHPALSHLPDSWWPSLSHPTVPHEPLHFVEFNGFDDGFINVLRSDPWSCMTIEAADGHRPSDIIRSASTSSRTPDHIAPLRDGDPPVHPSRAPPVRPAVLIWLTVWGVTSAHFIGRRGGTIYSVSLAFLSCYLAARGAPTEWERVDHDTWQLDLDDVAGLTARLHEYWWHRPLSTCLPHRACSVLHHHWNQYAVWSGGVPSSLLIATDGSGLRGGSWAFAAWACHKGRWHRIGWAAAPLSGTAWAPSTDRQVAGTQASYRSELVALESAGLWATAMLDRWQLYMATRPRHITIAVDNAAALQVAAGHALAPGPSAAAARQVWQAVQARVTTEFRHVHSHTGGFANTVADTVAEWASHDQSAPFLHEHSVHIASSDLEVLFPRLWLLPHSRLVQGRPVYSIQCKNTPYQQSQEQLPSADVRNTSTPCSNPGTSVLQIHCMTANIQTTVMLRLISSIRLA